MTKPFNALDLFYEAMVDAELARMDREARAVLQAEWLRVYGHRDNPAWVVYDMLYPSPLTPPPNPTSMGTR